MSDASNLTDPHPPRVSELLRLYGLTPSKGLGQHFLVDSSILRKIVEAASLSPSDTVIEVGPGLGILTSALVDRAAHVIAVEKDEKLASLLPSIVVAKPNLAVVNADVLELPPSDLLSKHSLSGDYKVVANLPYYAAAPILRHFLEATPQPLLMVVMLQKEVAGNIAAGPGAMSLLSVAIQLYARPSIVTVVPAGCFFPRPKVDSAVVRLDIHRSPPVNLESTERFFTVVKAGFATPRKQLRNSLANGLRISPAQASAFLSTAGIDPSRRAETLTLDEWARLTRAAVLEAPHA